MTSQFVQVLLRIDGCLRVTCSFTLAIPTVHVHVYSITWPAHAPPPQNLESCVPYHGSRAGPSRLDAAILRFAALHGIMALRVLVRILSEHCVHDCVLAILVVYLRGVLPGSWGSVGICRRSFRHSTYISISDARKFRAASGTRRLTGTEISHFYRSVPRTCRRGGQCGSNPPSITMS